MIIERPFNHTVLLFAYSIAEKPIGASIQAKVGASSERNARGHKGFSYYSSFQY